MKKKAIFIFIILYVLLNGFVFAHPGGLDANGGHTNKKTGEYHYHRGPKAKNKNKNKTRNKNKNKTNKKNNNTQKNTPKENKAGEELNNKKYISLNNFSYIKIIIGISAIIIIMGISIYYIRLNQ